MVKHFFLTCSVLLSAAAQTALAKEYDLEGTLVTQNNYVRIQSCNLKNTYALLPGSEMAMKRQQRLSVPEKICLKARQSMLL